MIGFILAFVNDVRYRRYNQAQDDLSSPDYSSRIDDEVMMADILEREEEEYMHEVDHGWDDAWADHYLGEGP